MVKSKSEIKLLDLVDLDFLQRFQDAFAKATGVGSIMVDNKGPITKPSNFTEFCLDTMINPQGQKKCTECDLRWGAVAAAKKEPVIYTCFAGITAFAVPIIIDDNYIASISGGLVLTKPPSEEHFRKLAKSLGIDEEEYIKTVHKIPIVPKEKVQAYADLLFIVANAISKIAHKNKELIEKNKREVLSKKMVEILRATLDSEEIKKRFIEMASSYFGADRCLFVDYDTDKKKFLPIRLVKLKSPKIKSYIGVETEVDLPEFDARLIKGKNIVIKNLEKTLARKDFSENKSLMMLKKAGVKSDYALPVLYQNKVVGVLVLHFSTKVKILTHDEFDFLKMLRDSVGTALYQAELFEKTKKQIEREIFLRNIIETIRDSLDINETKKKIVDILGKTIGADRCFIMEYDTQTNSFLKVKDEYVSAPEIPAYVGNDVNVDVPNIMESFKQGKMLIIDEKKVYLDGELQNFEQENEAIEKFGVQGAYGVPLFYKKEFLGAFGVHYLSKQHKFNDEEVALIKDIANQMATAIYQAQLYEKMQDNAKIERVIRTIIQKAISTENEEEIIKTIVTEEGKLLRADRCFFIEYDLELDTVLPVKEYAEYLSSKNIKSHVERIPKKDEVDVFMPIIRQKTFAVVENIYELDLPDSTKKMLIEDLGVKAYLIAPVFYGDNLLGAVVLHYVNDFVQFTQEEIDMAHTIANQSASILYQAKLHMQNKMNVEREKILRKIISTAIKTFDFSQIKQIVTDVGKITKADRCYFVETDVSGLKGKSLDYESEYLASADIKSIIGYQFPENDVRDFLELYMHAKDLVYFDYENLQKMPDVKYEGIKKYSSLFDLKSGIGVPFMYEGKPVAVLCIEYVKEKVLPDTDELDFLRLLGQQVGILYTQIKLYNDLKKTAERERILRNISNKIRSSLDIEKIKKEIVTQLGTFFNADRVAMAHYDYIADNYIITPESEYRSSDKVKTFVGQDFISAPGFAKHIRDLHFKGKNIIFNNLEEYIDENKLDGTGVDEFYKEYGFASSAAINVYYEDTFLGNLVITFEKQRDITDEEINFLNVISDQIGVAFHQAELYLKTRQQAESETLLRNIISNISGSLDIEEILDYICKETAKLFNVQRTTIVSLIDKNNYSDFKVRKEYTTSSERKCLHDSADFSKAAEYWWDNLINKNRTMSVDNIEESNAPDAFKNSYKSLGIKSIVGSSIMKGDEVWGCLVLSEYEHFRHWTTEEITLLNSIADQIYIAINQTELYQKQKETAERETLLRKIFETMRSSLDINVIKNAIVEEVGKALEADICFIMGYKSDDNKFETDVYSEYRLPQEDKSYVGYDLQGENVKFFINMLKDTREIFSPDTEEFIINNNLEGTLAAEHLREYKIKSGYGEAIYYGDTLFGYIGVLYTKYSKKLTQDELGFLKTITAQAGIAFYQASLYKKIQKQAEREKVNRSIIEILRNTFDKDYIKNIFVRTIGNFFKADRVFLSEYDSYGMIYKPVEQGSEFLSSPNEKSFVGYDWGCAEAAEYIQPLLAKKELNIPNWGEYIKNNTKGQDFISLFEDSNVKSSYNFPIVYQERLMGYFCIEFTKRYFTFEEDDLTLIRSICRQCAIAIYQSELYQKAQENAQAKITFSRGYADKIRDSLNEIIDLSNVSIEQASDPNELISRINMLSKNLREFTNEMC